MRDHLVAHARQTGEEPEELKVPPVPAGTERLWAAFNELRGTQSPAAGGAAPISMTEIAAWQGVFGVQLTPWEVETVLALDRAALAVLNEGQDKK